MNVTVSQHTTRTLEDDVAEVRRLLANQKGPTLLVGHSYGGAIITEAGNDPKVAGLVYVAAFAPDDDESVQALLSNPQPGEPIPPILPPQNGLLFLDRAKFHESFCGDLPKPDAEFTADSQLGAGVAGLGGKITHAAWKSKPSWYLVATEDHMIPPAAQRKMAKRAGASATEQPGSHSVYISQPQAVVSLIRQAAGEAQLAAA